MFGRIAKTRVYCPFSVSVLLAVAVAGSLAMAGSALAAIKDSDGDGLADEAEIATYRTDPTKYDTDIDGFSDGSEVLHDTDPLSAQDSPALRLQNKQFGLLVRTDPIQWYISRIAGIVSYVLLSLVVLFGLVQTSKVLLKYKFMGAYTAMQVHRAIAWSGMATVLLHVGMLFFDSYIRLNFTEVLVPFLLKRDLVSAMGYSLSQTISLGIVGLYLIVILVATSELRNKVVSIRFWRTVHYISFVGYILFTLHGFLSGTDSGEPWMIGIYAVSLTSISLALAARLLKKRLFLPGISQTTLPASPPTIVRH